MILSERIDSDTAKQLATENIVAFAISMGSIHTIIFLSTMAMMLDKSKASQDIRLQCNSDSCDNR